VAVFQHNPHVVRVLTLLFAVIILQIPVFWIGGLVGERSQRRAEAVEEITAKCGRKQTVTGPMLVVPYLQHTTYKPEKGPAEVVTTVRYLVSLPGDLAIQGNVSSERRARGIYSVPVYQSVLDVKGSFDKLETLPLGIPDNDVLWDRAVLALGISDARAIYDEIQLEAGDDKLAFLPGMGEYDTGLGSGIQAKVGARAKDGFAFHFPMKMNGSQGLFFTPFGRTTKVALESNWPSPSFQGNWLPQSRSTDEKGFKASWSIPYLGRNYPQIWTAETPGAAVGASAFGVDFVETVTVHRMAERSVKYASLFLILTFTAVWLMEVLAAARVHPMQYLMIGAALCLFFLLELSLAEQLGFITAYLLASAGVILMVGAYARSILGATKRGLAIGGVVAALYGYLYVLLVNEDYALLVGSLGLFAVLALVMFLTRRVNWFGDSNNTTELKRAA
jgi:inner membrane protein